MTTSIAKQLFRRTMRCFPVIISIYIIPACALALNDSFVIPQDLQEHLTRQAWQEGNIERTQSLLDDGLAQYPESALLWDIQASVALKKQNYEKAAEAGKKALKISPTPLRHTNMGWILRFQKQYNKAAMHYKMGLADPNMPKESYFYLAECLDQAGRQKEAVKYYQKYLDVSLSGSKRSAAEKRLASLSGNAPLGDAAYGPPAIYGGLESMSAEQRLQQDEACNQRFPGLVAIDYDPGARHVTCGCPDDGIDIGKGCLSSFELEIIRAVNRKDIKQAQQLAARVKPGTQFFSNVLEDVKYLVRINDETPWMLDQESFKKEMARRDQEFQKAMQEYDQESRQNDALWAQLVQNTLETQMKAISGAVAALAGAKGSVAQPSGNARPSEASGGLSRIEFTEDDEEEVTDRIVLMETPYDGPEVEIKNWMPPLNVDPDEIVGVWQCELFKIAVAKDGKFNYVAKVLETYPVPKKKGKGETKYPFSRGEICCRVGEGGGGGGPDSFLSYRGGGWVWEETGRKWSSQDLLMKQDEEGLYLYMYFGEADGHWFSNYKMRKIK